MAAFGLHRAHGQSLINSRPSGCGTRLNSRRLFCARARIRDWGTLPSEAHCRSSDRRISASATSCASSARLHRRTARWRRNGTPNAAGLAGRADASSPDAGTWGCTRLSDAPSQRLPEVARHADIAATNRDHDAKQRDDVEQCRDRSEEHAVGSFPGKSQGEHRADRQRDSRHEQYGALPLGDGRRIADGHVIDEPAVETRFATRVHGTNLPLRAPPRRNSCTVSCRSVEGNRP
jgi:hypothetical protein